MVEHDSGEAPGGEPTMRWQDASYARSGYSLSRESHPFAYPGKSAAFDIPD
jgi:hypothetical protein